MSLFPFSTTNVNTATTRAVSSPVREYEIDFTSGRLTGRIVEGVDAIYNWAYLALKARRYKWLIYSWFYGAEHYNLIGYSYSDEYLQSEAKRYIEECLKENEHITGITDLVVSRDKDLLSMRFTLVTDVGSKEVEISV